MVTATAWIIFFLGVIHCIAGVAMFKKPLAEAIQQGFVGKLRGSEGRLAFWFIIVGPLLMTIGQVAIYASVESNLFLLKLIGYYLASTSIIGVMAFPIARNGFWVLLVAAPILIASGYGFIV
ncbi:DUF6463 family protein [Undibacterium sp.]|jgi:hypothetical protein|uniref:DUF6463 family protein n=1 Tax=Undibacterium sp. TaxID=1914977 RepID=UPI002C02B3BB|nr:DUF6463 family protein [Undibacterium sp.]HTD04455.1 DUF6463 family protein [Undibacterium sp.]